MSCYPSIYCPCCGGVCATDDVASWWLPSRGQWPQRPVEIPGPDYLDRYRTVAAPDDEKPNEVEEEKNGY
jgi:hypothetical protein